MKWDYLKLSAAEERIALYRPLGTMTYALCHGILCVIKEHI